MKIEFSPSTTTGSCCIVLPDEKLQGYSTRAAAIMPHNHNAHRQEAHVHRYIRYLFTCNSRSCDAVGGADFRLLVSTRMRRFQPPGLASGAGTGGCETKHRCQPPVVSERRFTIAGVGS